MCKWQEWLWIELRLEMPTERTKTAALHSGWNRHPPSPSCTRSLPVWHLGIGYLVARFVAQLAFDVLPGLGVDRAFTDTDILPAGTSVSSIVARVAQIAVILFFAIAATRLLGFPELTMILDEVLELGGRVVFGGVVIAAGFLVAGVLARLIDSAGENGLAASIVKWAAIVLFVFMGLQFMGGGEEIVQTAFSALIIGGAVAAALAFSLGGRESAGRKLEQVEHYLEKNSSSDSDPTTRDDPADLPPGA